MSIFKKNKILVTHNGTFHADDLFATAVLSLVFDGNIKVIRTRDEELIKKADVVYDVGGIYDEELNRFDHHQKGGAGTRENGIPYSSFGLVWKKFGEKLCGSKKIADLIDKKLVQIIDANDNGIDLFEVKGEVGPYTIQDMFFSFRPSWKEHQNFDVYFMKVLPFVKENLIREITRTRDELEAEDILRSIYEKTEDKRIIVLDTNYPWPDIIFSYGEPLYVISEKMGIWRAEAVRKERYKFEVRKPFPESWAGKRDEEFVNISGVPDAIFCHNGRFLVGAKSKEGAIELAKKALEN